MVGPILPETYQLIWGTLPTYIASKGLAKRQLDGLNTVMDGLNARVCWPIRRIYFPILIMETLQNFWNWPTPFKSNFDSASIVSSIDWFEHLFFPAIQHD